MKWAEKLTELSYMCRTHTGNVGGVGGENTWRGNRVQTVLDELTTNQDSEMKTNSIGKQARVHQRCLAYCP